MNMRKNNKKRKIAEEEQDSEPGESSQPADLPAAGDGDGEDEVERSDKEDEGVDSETSGDDEKGDEEDVGSDEGEEESEPDLVGEGEVDLDASLGETDSGDSTEAMDSDDDEPIALKPIKMHFKPAEYNKKIKLPMWCYIKEVLTTFDELKHPLTTFERNWFENHSQFKHFWHLPRDGNYKVMGMWMLLLRTTCIEKKREVWFVVNGVPVRYGIREHALITGFNCRNYPIDYNKAGSKTFMNNFVKNHCGSLKVTREKVREKLKDMVPMKRSKDRLKMAVLYLHENVSSKQDRCDVDSSISLP